jgi:glyoxylase-like metal-dependent hydrolase (beta-lactamase superfamily II)
VVRTIRRPRDPLDVPLWFALGEVRFSVISDGFIAIGPARDCFPDLTAEEAVAAFGSRGAAEVRLPQNLLLADVRGTRILFEAGLGTAFPGPVGRDAGRALAGLRAAGVDPVSIDVIALSHAHPDHVGGLIAGDGNAVFPRAEVVIARAEYDEVTRPDELDETASFAARQRGFARRCLTPYRSRVRCVEDGEQPVAGVTVLACPGHSPGHTAFAIDTSAGRVVSWGDTCHRELLLQRPDLGFSADHDSRQAARSRRRLLARVAAEGWRVHAYHLAHPGLGTVRAVDGDGYVWVSDGGARRTPSAAPSESRRRAGSSPR